MEVKLMSANVLEETRPNDEAPLPLPKIKSVVTDAVEDGVHSARRAIRYGRYAAEDAIMEAQHKVKQKPLQAMGLVLAAGVLIGGFLSWIEFRRR
jgi:ElaB/YqjD/DUF883 family membrane-anchored ribosome-binding protein